MRWGPWRRDLFHVSPERSARLGCPRLLATKGRSVASSELREALLHTSLPASDLDRAKRFFEEKLGLTPSSASDYTAFYELPGGRFEVFLSGGAAAGNHTQMEWMVTNIEGIVAELRERGVVFDEYDTPDFKTVDGIATFGTSKVAWFKDSEGNVHSIAQVE
jgi:catechol 2,3-dioxygenase-like lactoylglutathione lyase family enzyme